ncbi:hypothetical protein [Roseicyclus persicicus]|uniref:DUF1127 domain-containing protein n=1 Tax=Roseicyclus persicicus TaxID=2650661 RepID=A0A7X6GVI4_9RHOB|nr:hypothetical protein [Roseibacterium persicicum]NKX43141.1 hypothetical protein [Roseibacterium persicicum]
MTTLILTRPFARLRAWFARPWAVGLRAAPRPRRPRVRDLSQLPDHLRRDIGLPPQPADRPPRHAPPVPVDPLRHL